MQDLFNEAWCVTLWIYFFVTTFFLKYFSFFIICLLKQLQNLTQFYLEKNKLLQAWNIVVVFAEIFSKMLSILN